jgi:hypothetical protein
MRDERIHFIDHRCNNLPKSTKNAKNPPTTEKSLKILQLVLYLIDYFQNFWWSIIFYRKKSANYNFNLPTMEIDVDFEGFSRSDIFHFGTKLCHS